MNVNTSRLLTLSLGERSLIESPSNYFHCIKKYVVLFVEIHTDKLRVLHSVSVIVSFFFNNEQKINNI